MRHRSRAVLLSLLLPAFAACAHGDRPKAYPADFDTAGAQASLVAVHLLATDYLPKFPECERPDTICMDPAPTWLRLRTVETVHGAAPPAVFHAATTSHYGRMDALGKPEAPMLMVVLADGPDRVMPRYARAGLFADGAGALHLVVQQTRPLFWLPCDVATLRQPITDPVLRQAAAWKRADYEQFMATNAADLYDIVGEQALPKYSIPLSRLRDHLAGRTLAAGDFTCDGDAGG